MPESWTLFGPGLSPGALAALVFLLRIGDVSLGTMRTIVVVAGRIPLSVVLGFFEVLLWITAVSQVVLRLHESPVLIVAYAGGFAAGNAAGIALERRLALGQCVVRVISRKDADVVHILSTHGRVRGVYGNNDGDPEGRLVFATLARAELPEVVRQLKALDPDAFYVVDRFSETNGPEAAGLARARVWPESPLPRATGWRAVLKMK